MKKNVDMSIGARSVLAVKWSVLTTIARFTLQLIAQIILARLLGPENYGIFGIAIVVYGLSYFLATIGLSWALVKLPTIDLDDIRFVFTWQLIASIFVAVLLYSLAPWIAGDIFNDARSQPIMRWLALACPLSAASVVSGALLQREIDFKVTGLIQLVSYFIGYILVGIPLAFAGYGVYALLSAWLTQAASNTIGLYFNAPFSLRPLLRSPNSRALVKTGAAVFVTNFANWLSNNLDRLMIGKYLDAISIGVYNAAFNLASQPNQLLVGALQPVFMASGARINEDRERFRLVFEQVLGGIFVLLLPVFVIPAVLAPEIIQMLLGPAWQNAAPILRLLVLTTPFVVAGGMSTPVLWNTDRGHLEVILQLPILALAAVCFVMFADRGVLVSAMIAAGMIFCRSMTLLTAAQRQLGIRLTDTVCWLLRGLALAAITGAITFTVAHYLPSWHALPKAAVATACAFLALIALIFAFPQVIGAQATALILRFVPRFKPWLHR